MGKFKEHYYKGCWISRSWPRGMYYTYCPDRLMADTLSGLKAMIRNYLKKEKA